MICYENESIIPIKRLCVRVLLQAIKDIVEPRTKMEDRRDAKWWFESFDDEPMSLEWICNVLLISASSIRNLIEGLQNGTIKKTSFDLRERVIGRSHQYAPRGKNRKKLIEQGLFMPQQLKRPCPKPGCGALIGPKEKYCKDHQLITWKDERESRPEHVALYASARWLKVRALILKKHPVCQLCDERLATLVDHIRPVRDGGDPFAESNLQSLCRDCHEIKTREDIKRRRA